MIGPEPDVRDRRDPVHDRVHHGLAVDGLVEGLANESVGQPVARSGHVRSILDLELHQVGDRQELDIIAGALPALLYLDG